MVTSLATATLICEGCTDKGMCCRYVELPLARSLMPDEMRWLLLHPGLSIRSLNGTTLVRFETNCEALQDNKCSMYDQRPLLCRLWPDKPQEQAPVGCVYRKE